MPTRRLDTYFYHHSLDVEKMSRAAVYLEGEHDFKSFCAVNAQVKTTVRTIYACSVTKADDIITIRADRQRFFVQYGPHYCRDADTGRRQVRSSRSR